MISQVRANIGGKWYNLSYNPETSRYEAEITPDESSYGQPGGRFNVLVEATNNIGVSTNVDGSTFPELYLSVKETTPPEIIVVSPMEGYITTNTPEIIATITDTQSGVLQESITVFVDGNTQPYTAQEIDSGYKIAVKIDAHLSEGEHQVKISALDNDKNIAEKTAVYFVDTVPPDLDILSPDNRHIVDVDKYLVSVAAHDKTSSIKSVHITVNGDNIGDLDVGRNGVFSKIIALEIGSNDVIARAIDNAGLESVVSFRMVRMITDRTKNDVNSKDLVRGSYKASDINRVYDAMDLLNQVFTDLGYLVQYNRYKTYQDESTPTEIDFSKYLENLQHIRDVLPVPYDTPLVPESIKWMTYGAANDIEKILVMIDELFIGLKSVWHSGEIMSGEI